MRSPQVRCIVEQILYVSKVRSQRRGSGRGGGGAAVAVEPGWDGPQLRRLSCKVRICANFVCLWAKGQVKELVQTKSYEVEKKHCHTAL